MLRMLIVVFLLTAGMIIVNEIDEQQEQSPDNAGKYEKVRLVMTANGTSTGIETLTAKHFAELVEQASGGDVHIEFYPNDELTGGNTNEAVRALTEGTVDMGAYVSGTMSLLWKLPQFPGRFQVIKKREKLSTRLAASTTKKFWRNTGLSTSAQLTTPYVSCRIIAILYERPKTFKA